MLTEIRCAEFKSNGQPRPPIKFSSGLNTILGDRIGSNFIGKSTFLMIVDFVFGGNDYIEKSQDVQQQVGRHVIQFAFMFSNHMHYFARDTIMHHRVNRCDSEYNVISDISIDEFRKLLFDGYAISLPSVSFRDMITRYFRVYRRDNLDENHPLRSVPQEREEDSIASLVKLFGVNGGVEGLRSALKEAKEKCEIFRKSVQYDYVHGVTTKKQLKENQNKIRDLTERLNQISGQKNRNNKTSWRTLLLKKQNDSQI